MLVDSKERWSRISVQTISSLSEQKSHVKWRAFLFTLILFVFLEVAVVMYVGLGSGTRVTGTSSGSENQRQDSVYDIRWHLGLTTVEAENNASHEMAFLYGNSTLTMEIFAEQYTELCENYFIPRTINANEKFFGLFDRISSQRAGYVLLDQSNRQSNRSTYTKYRTNVDNASRVSEDKKLCPCVPDTLYGAINVSMEVPYVGELELTYPDIKNGGFWKPPDCVPRHRTAVIIPFRDREEHLRILLSYLHPMLQRQMLYYRIFVVEQAFPAVFNKASIMNVGFREATLADSFDCFIFHDVDMIPENDYNFYTCTAQPRHVGSHCDKFNYKVPYPNIFGGVTAFTSKQFIKANGFSNEYYGWGGEDDDMFQRIKASGMNISRFPGSIARYTMIKHGADAGNPYNTKSYVAWQSRPDHYRRNGISQLRYYRRRMELRPLYTWYLVELPEPNYAPIPARLENKSSADNLSVPSLITTLTYLLFIYLSLTRLGSRLW